jgi:hypothetical protein
MPATVYVTTYYCLHPKPVTPLFYDYLLWKGQATYRGGPLPELGARFDLQNPAERVRVVKLVYELVEKQRWSQADKDAFSPRLAAALGVDYGALESSRILQLMNPAEVAEVAAGGIDIQLHTHRHRTPVDRALFLREIDDNRRHIRELCGLDATHFCYPSGVHDERFLPWLREAGVRSATTCESGLAASGGEPLLLPRIVDTSNLREVEFESWLCGVGAITRDRRRAGARGSNT